MLAFVEIAIFVFILLLGLVYVWKKGDLEWMKKVAIEPEGQGESIVPKASYVP